MSRAIAFFKAAIGATARAVFAATLPVLIASPAFAQSCFENNPGSAMSPGTLFGPSTPPSPGSIVTLTFVPGQAIFPWYVVEAWVFDIDNPGQTSPVWRPGDSTEYSFRIPTCANQHTYMLATRISLNNTNCYVYSNPVTVSWGTIQPSGHVETPATACVNQPYQITVDWDCNTLQNSAANYLELADNGGAPYGLYPTPTFPCNGPSTSSVTLDAPSQPGVRLHRFHMVDGCGREVWSGSTATMFIGGQPTLLMQPQSATTCPTGAATFAVTVGGTVGSGVISYQWQWQPTPGGNWVNIVDGPNTDPLGGPSHFTAVGARMAAVTVSNAGGGSGTAGSHWEKRCIVVSSACGGGSVTSNPATLTICVADTDDGSGTGTCDGGVTIDDLLYYLRIFEEGAIAADVDDGSGTGSPDGGITIDDLLYYLLRFEAGC